MGSIGLSIWQTQGSLLDHSLTEIAPPLPDPSRPSSSCLPGGKFRKEDSVARPFFLLCSRTVHVYRRFLYWWGKCRDNSMCHPSHLVSSRFLSRRSGEIYWGK